MFFLILGYRIKIPANETLREKMQNFWSHFANFFAKFRIFRENYWSKIWRIEKFVKTMSFMAAKINCGILYSALIAEYYVTYVLFCHINNFFSFTLINVWWRESDFTRYLFKFSDLFWFFLYVTYLDAVTSLVSLILIPL